LRKSSDAFEVLVSNNIKNYRIMRNTRDNLNSSESLDQNGCSVCKDLLVHMQRFLDMLETARKSHTSDWLTVDEIARELKISKSVVYRLIRNGKLEAVDLVDTNGKIAQKGHYRVRRSSLNHFLESKKIKPPPKQIIHSSRSRCLLEVKNHLGL